MFLILIAMVSSSKNNNKKKSIYVYEYRIYENIIVNYITIQLYCNIVNVMGTYISMLFHNNTPQNK